MRQIKFRVWDTERKKMYPVDQFTCNWNRNFITNTSELVIKKSNILMQFTGLLDCEGKEVYEGDIIEYDDYDWFEHKKTRKSAEVIFEDGMFVTDERESSPAVYCLENIKILGNLYEHPQLLNNES